MKKKIRSISAFTLVEVVLCVGIIMFAGVLLVGLIPVGLKSSREAAEITRASALLETIEHELRLLSSAGISSLGFPAALGATDPRNSEFTGFYGESGQIQTTSQDARFALRITKSQVGRLDSNDLNFPACHYGIRIWWPPSASIENSSGILHSQITLPRRKIR